MIIPSIDIQGGQVVQLVGGRELALEAGPPGALLERFAPVGEVAVVDLDAALGRGDNRSLIDPLLSQGRLRVGGGIRDEASARGWLARGAARVVLGTRAEPELLRTLPRDRVIAALDARDGEVVVEGWTRGTGRTIEDRVRELRPFVGGFLVTFVEREGRLGGTDLDRARRLKEIVGEDCTLTVAGGVTTAEEVLALDRLGIDAQVGMALYTGQLDLAAAVCAPLRSDRPDGLWATAVVDERGVLLGLAWSDEDSVREALATRSGVYRSRQRGLWRKGETSGATQELLRVDVDCDRDTLRFTVRQRGPGFCHRRTRSCFGPSLGLARLEETLVGRLTDPPPGSYTRRLLEDPALLAAKLREEADELACAPDREAVRQEAADLLYFTLVRLAAADVSLVDVERVLDERAGRPGRRPGDAKPAYLTPRRGAA